MAGINLTVFTDDPADPDLIQGLAAYDRKDWVTAEAPLRRAAERGNVTAIFKLANTVSNLGRQDEAVPLWQLASDQGHDGAANNLANYLKAQGRVEEALALQQRSAEAGNVEAMFNLGMALDALGRTDEAYDWFERAIDAGNGRAAAYLGHELLKAGHRDEGLIVLQSGVDLGNMSACLMLAVDAQERDDYPVMAEWAQRALEMPDDPREAHQVKNAWGLLGLGLYLSGRVAESIDPLQRATDLGNEHAAGVLQDARSDLTTPSPFTPTPPSAGRVDWAASSPTQNPSPAPTTPRPKFCTACGQPLGDGVRFCGSCGTRIDV